jgi:putative DNA primase/helicase
VHIPEGEKDADTLAALGLIATTNSEGAKKGSWTPELNRWFHGVRQVFIPEDNDEPGRAFAREKARALALIVPEIRIVSFPDVPDGQDVSYWLRELKHTKDEYLARCAEAPIWRDGELNSVRASTIEMTHLEWLWPNRFALGKIGIIAGLPDEGKGLLLSFIIACCTNPALAWPNDEGRAPQGNVILLTAEDDPADTVLPRLAAAGADLSKVEIIQLVRDHDSKTGEQRNRMFSLVHDLEKLRAKITDVGSVVLIVIDPISAYLGIGEVDSFRDADVRSVLGPLKELAGEMRVTALAIMHFNKKTDVLNMMLRICNSIAFAAASRHAFGVIDDPDNQRKLFVRGKNNLGQRDDRSLAFRFEVRTVGISRRTGKPILAPFIVWEAGYVDVTATEALQAVSGGRPPAAPVAAKKFLLDILANAPVPAAEIEAAAKAEGIAMRTLARAKTALGIVSEKGPMPQDPWTWRLPGEGEAETNISH